MASLTQITSAQAGKEITANENLAAVSPAALFSKRVPGTTGLTWSYYGGTFTKADGTRVQIANGTLTLTASSTLYLQANPADGVVSAVTGAFTAGYLPLYKVVTGTSSVTSIEDWREFATRTHAHAIPDVTGLQTALDAKLDDSQATAAGLALLGAADVVAQRSALGLANHQLVTVDASGYVSIATGAGPSIDRALNIGSGGSDANIFALVKSSVVGAFNNNVQLHDQMLLGAELGTGIVFGKHNGAGVRFGSAAWSSVHRLLIGTTTDDGMNLFQCAGSGRFDKGVTVPNCADDAAAATAGVPVGAIYRTGTTLKVRAA